MSYKSPFRVRPNLHLNLVSRGSPTSRYTSPSTTSQHNVTYSPFQSASLKRPTPHNSPQFTPQSATFLYGSYGLGRIRRLARSRVIWFIMILIGLMWWWSNGGQRDFETTRQRSRTLSKELFGPDITDGLSFFPASNPKIHYVGRWTSTPNRLRKEGTFAGVYFDITINSSSTLMLSLHNAPLSVPAVTSELPAIATDIQKSGADIERLSFRPSTAPQVAPPPIALLARIDQEEYILLPNSSSLVAIRSGDLDRHTVHNVRIVAPMVDYSASGILALEGIWLEKGGKLLRVEGSQLGQEVEEEDAFEAENKNIGQKHRIGLSRLTRHGFLGNAEQSTREEGPELDQDDSSRTGGMRGKMLEIVTDAPGALNHAMAGARSGGADGILGGVMGWEYLIGEMFGVDHVSIGMEGMCLTQDCIVRTGEPAGMGDVFFRSGPPNSPYFAHSWTFDSYIPDVMILNLGGSDFDSFERHATENNQTAWSFFQRFEDNYVSFIKAVRQLAYRDHPSVIAAASGLIRPNDDDAPASIPIFVMRPLRGQLEHATQGAVNRLRADGDQHVFWLDTSGWLDPDEPRVDWVSFFKEEREDGTHWRLTERGNQRVAIFLHMHVCRYLAEDASQCAFLPPEVYRGQAFDPDEANFDRHLQREKEQRLKRLFWRDQQRNIDLLPRIPLPEQSEGLVLQPLTDSTA